MPRDASGTYTLPAGNPVVVGTTIDASWANTTMDDIETVLTDSLSRTGDGGMLVAMEFASGLVSAPGITWTSEPTSGFYLADTNDMRVSIAGSDRARFRADASDPFQIWIGAAWANVMNLAGDYTITGDWVFPSDTIIDSITATDLVSKAQAETITGIWTVSAAQPKWVFDETDGGADERTYLFRQQGGSFGLYTALDASPTTVENPVWVVGRTAGAVDSFAISAPVTATSYEGILAANILSRIVDEAVSGMWTLDGDQTTVGFGTGGKVKDGGDTARPIGFNVMPVYEIDVADTLDLAHNGMYWHKDSGAAVAITLDEDADIPQGATIVLANEDDSDITITEGVGVTIKWMDGLGAAPPEGNLVLTRAGVATIYKYSDTVYHVWGNGLS